MARRTHVSANIYIKLLTFFIGNTLTLLPVVLAVTFITEKKEINTIYLYFKIRTLISDRLDYV